MPDLDTSLQELRADLRNTLTRPDLSEVADRARQQKVRRRMQVGAIVAVVLVSVVVPAMRIVQSDNQPAASPPDPPPPYVVDFADADHGYAFRQDCESDQGPCAFSLRSTDDSGRTWHPVQLPEGGEKYARGGIVVVGPKQLFFARMNPGIEAVPEQFFTENGGRTWSAPKEDAQTSPILISSGADLNPICLPGAVDQTCMLGVGVRTPDGVRPVLTQPPLASPNPGKTATESGRYWAAGREPSTGNWAVSVTADGGTTWTTNVLDLKGLPSPSVDGAWSVAERGPDMYLTVVGNVGVGPLELLAVFHSTNKGVAWTRTWQPTAEHELQATAGNAVATADGQLLVYSTVAGTVTSSDKGRTFTRSAHQLPGPVTWTRAGYLAVGPNNTFELSRDGETWRKFEIH